MRYHLRHLTSYTYTRPVFLEPHLLKVRPRSDTAQSLVRFDLSVSPEPDGLASLTDAENNPCHLVWFSGLSERFEIRSEFVVETLLANPFDSLLLADDSVPPQLTAAERRILAPCLDVNALAAPGEHRLLASIGAEAAAGSTTSLAFLAGLNSWLYERIEKVERAEPGFQPVGRTIAARRGACRDTAMAFMAVCRQMGIPARFVSGCQEGDPGSVEGELHAWAEVYLPGFGWRGYDPTHGLAVADRHIAYAASAVPAQAAPVSGSFRGTGAAAAMQHTISFLAWRSDGPGSGSGQS